ncbi:ATP-binding protein [Streptomyces buecherae]|uniref:ATP-binding protein n=1 Tax=Streptomyces buecherae TaxID=2763006 RepID=UPI0033FB066F
MRPPVRSRYAIPRSASEARRLIENLVRAQFPAHRGAGPAAETVADMLLVTSELVTNAIRHGGGVVGLWARLDADGLRLAVRDRSDDLPFVKARTPGDPVPVGGYGWPMVRRLASEVRVTPCPGGGKEIRIAVPVT